LRWNEVLQPVRNAVAAMGLPLRLKESL